MSTPTSPENNPKVIIERERLFWWLKIIASLGAFLYLLLCTYLWNIVYALFLIYKTDNAPNAVTARLPWCEPGDWVLETFQPMVSDKAMIEHLQKNKAEMTRLAEMAARNRNHWADPDFKKLERKLNLFSVDRTASWAERPYSLEEAQISHACITNIDAVLKPVTREARNQAFEDCRIKDEAIGRDLSMVSVEPWFGKTSAQYFCSTERNSFKKYIYFPGGIPYLEDGRLLSMTSYWESHRVFASAPSYELVKSTDIDPRGSRTVVRKIDERWFIRRN